ncbi:MAG: TraR/DksA C4-type zinc finger protein [Thermomicrobium sp.]|nr:TraR/DksA C4-type zinc finger protein [Thermomicrobium sp.]MCS7246353.1 TraR/DksA C4-type zinc finger protein [Thermomicrobium sp.]MDW7982396.1 TraR/DksA C4-type zinc finger protein [Thermomicrobium sp.]
MNDSREREWLDAMRRRLEERRVELERLRQQTLRLLSAEGASQADEGTVASHPADAATDVTMAEIEQSVLRTIEEELHEVDAALERLANGTYGYCSDCGRPIERARLEVMPWAARCLSDQERFERELERRRR